MIQPYASDARHSRGRLHQERAPCAYRGPFERDRDRILHSAAFRRLKHKTQVFVEHEGDHYRTRLTHSLEVAQAARALSRRLGLDEDLAEALALAHDLGHTPFGHAGERALNAAMRDYGGFDHNAQSLRVVTALERHYAGFDGLNLSWETLEGLAKHNGPLLDPPAPIRAYNSRHDLELKSQAGPEAQIAALCDDLAYLRHDLDDGLRAGVIHIEALEDLALTKSALDQVDTLWPALEADRRPHEAMRAVFALMINDVAAETTRRLEVLTPSCVEEVRWSAYPVAAFSNDMKAATEALRAFLFEHMYRHPRVMRMNDQADKVVRTLFARLRQDPDLLAEGWREAALEADNPRRRARIIADYIAGMTDRYALAEYERLT